MNLFQKTSVIAMGAAMTLGMLSSNGHADAKWYHGGIFRPLYGPGFPGSDGILVTEFGTTNLSNNSRWVIATPTRDTAGNFTLVGVTSTNDNAQTSCTTFVKNNTVVVDDYPMAKTTGSYTHHTVSSITGAAGYTLLVFCQLPANGVAPGNQPRLHQLYVDE